jgi:hypothetical protein
MYLTEEERNELYKEWGELTGNPNPKLTWMILMSIRNTLKWFNGYLKL